ncbi:Antitoxin PezA [Sporomusa ovata DSM 2662]|uniref:HTH cro/C1-type domain-containing protein n=1 Tax=Sporomusa ovata TaxID=2378 RepID=A0A0U1L6U1_9FIRM|nr:helix-turn-helix domain-containing protein [Sporomusa ovata]EQB24654.1 putative transcriptional regulator [Sporomusa ovata DSM 2662]CQR74999.1 hypothetical protein SpAn4DRAFT_4363 [Sporomusa ovata]
MNFLGDKLKKLRKAKQLTMLQLSRLTGIKQSTLSLYENNKQTPSQETVVKLSKALNVDSYYFYLDRAMLLSEQIFDPEIPNPKTPYIVLAERAEDMGFPLEMLKAIINSWEKVERKKQEKP